MNDKPVVTIPKTKTTKTIAAAIGGIATILTAAFADNVLSVDETGTIISTVIVQGITVLSVYKLRNKPISGGD